MTKKFRDFFNSKINIRTAFILMFITGISVCICVCAVFYTVFSNAETSDNKFSKLLEAASIIESRFVGEADASKMTDSAINAMIDSLGDQWSYYVSLDELSSYETNANNNYVGVGITVERTEDKGLLITEIIPGGGAEEAGIISGSYIIAADGKSLIGSELTDATAIIKGDEGTSVILTIKDSNGKTTEYSVVRRKIEIDPVSADLIDEIGYIAISNFNEKSSSSFIEKVDSLIAQGAKSLIFDVRFNGGGRVTELCAMLDHLLPECTVFVTDDKAGNREIISSDAKCITKLPCVVLVNDSSYSAAEYFAAVLQEYDYADIIGIQTSGKGYSQAQISLKDGSVLSLSTMTYYTPSGKSLENVGIAPDYFLEVSEEEYFSLYTSSLDYDNDSQLQLAIEVVQSNSEK